MKKCLNIFAATLLAVALPSCSDDEATTIELQNVTLRMDVTLQAESGSNSAEASATRTPGDPGRTEFFERPTLLHLFMAVGDATTPESNPVYWYTFNTTADQWQRTADSLYFQTKDGNSSVLQRDIQVDRSVFQSATSEQQVRAYMLATFDGITFDGISQSGTEHLCSVKEADLLNVPIYAAGLDGKYESVSLRDVYSSPWNLRLVGGEFAKMTSPATDRTDYYGTATAKDDESVTFQMTLYHTAAKVDFQWNATSDVQANVMQWALLTNCPKQGYAFRLTEQVATTASYGKVLLDGSTTAGSADITADDSNSGHAARYADATTASVGNQWNGRAYTYILQPGDLSYSIRTSGSSGSAGKTYTGTAAISGSNVGGSNGSTNDIFAAWYKLDFTLGE